MAARHRDVRSNGDPTERSLDGLRAGAALLAAGRPTAARVAWARAGPPDDPLVVGLVGFAAAVASGRRREWARSRSRALDAERALGAVGDTPPVAVAPLRSYLASVASDPETVERRPPVAVRVEGTPSERSRQSPPGGSPPTTFAGTTPDPDALSLDALALAAAALAATEETFDPAVIDDGVRYAREEVAAGGSAFAALLTDLIAGRAPDVAYPRLRQRVARRRSEEADVDGLFD
jgi:hypothetical protein